MKEMGELVRKGREAQGYASQFEFAQAIGWFASAVNRLENGHARHLPSPEDLRTIAKTTGLSLESLLQAAGYLELRKADAGFLVRPDDPRAELLRLLDGVTEAQLQKAIRLVAVLLDGD